MTQGFVYLLSSRSYLPYLKTSLYSLRRFNQQPVTVFALPGLCEEVAALGVDVQPIELPAGKRIGRMLHYHAKLAAMLRSPYEDSVFIEADVLLMADIAHWFGYPLTLAQLGTRTTARGRPLINPGVVGYIDRTFWEMVQRYCLKLCTHEQAIINRKGGDFRCLDDSWMVCPERFKHVDNPKAIHFVRRAWERPTRYSQLWKDMQAQCE